MSLWDSVTKLVEKQLVDRAFNLSGQHKDLYCEKCQRITDHVSVSHAASLAKINRQQFVGVRIFSHVVGKLSDLNPVENMLIGRPYRCGQCGEEVID